MENLPNADKSLLTLQQTAFKKGSIFDNGYAIYTCKDHPETK